MAAPEHPEDPPKREEKRWIDSLAQRSTGLPGSAPSSKPASSGETSLWKLAGLGLEFAATVAIFALIGYELDKWFRTSPWCVIAFTLIALIGNLYLLVKEALLGDQDKNPKRRK